MGGSCGGRQLNDLDFQNAKKKDKKEEKEKKQYVELNFFKFLHQWCTKYDIEIKIPRTYTFVFENNLPIMFYNDQNGLVKMTKVSETKISGDFEKFQNKNYPFPAGVIKIMLSKQKQDICFPLMTAKEMMDLWYYCAKKQVPCIFQKYIIPMNKSAQILRTIYQTKVTNYLESSKIHKVLVVNSKEIEETNKKFNWNALNKASIIKETIQAIQKQDLKYKIFQLGNSDSSKSKFLIPDPINQKANLQNLKSKSDCSLESYQQFELKDFSDVDKALLKVKEVLEQTLLKERNSQVKYLRANFIINSKSQLTLINLKD